MEKFSTWDLLRRTAVVAVPTDTGDHPEAYVQVVTLDSGGTGETAGEITPVPVRTNGTERGGTVTSGGVSQQIMAANADRKGAWIQNLSTGALYVRVGAAAAADSTSLKISPDQLYEFPHAPVGAVNIFGAVTGQAFSAKEW